MAEKQFLKVSPTLADDAQFRSIADIPAAMLKDEYTIQLFPGTYTAITVNGADLSFVGVGDRDKIVVTTFTMGNASTGTATFNNFTINGTSDVQEGLTSALEVLEEDSTVNISCRDMVFGVSNVGVQNHGSGTVNVERSDLTGVDKAIRANAAMTFVFSELSANTYGEGNNAQIQVCTVTQCHGAGGNGDVTTETIIAAIS